jgi:hypothetical protein
MSQNLSEMFQRTISKRIQESETKMIEIDEWIGKLKDSGFDTTDLEMRQFQAEADIERLRGLLQ